MKRNRIHVRLTLQDREGLENILNSKTTTRHDKLKAEVLLLADIGEYGPKISNPDILAKLNISSRSLGRIKETYAKNSAIDDLFQFTGLSNQTNSFYNVKSNPNFVNKIRQYVEVDDSSDEPFLIKHIKCRVTLTKEDREFLERIINEGKQSTRKFNRAKILLLADEGIEGPSMTDQDIAEKLDVSESTVARVRRLFIINENVEAVLNFNHTKAGRPPKIDGRVQATLVAQMCSQPPEGRCRWTLNLLADRLVELNVVDAISHTAVGTALKKMNLNLGSEKSG
jgi:transposase